MFEKFFLGCVAACLACSSMGWAAPKPRVANSGKKTVQNAAAPRFSGYEKLLVPEDFEKAAGLKQVKLIPRNPASGVGGRLNFALKDGQLLLKLDGEVLEEKKFLALKATPRFKNMYWGRDPGFGPEAYEGPARGERFIFSFRKGEQWITLESFLATATFKPMLNITQLKQLARMVRDRLAER